MSSTISSSPSALIQQAFKAAPVEIWRRAFVASVIPFLGSFLWHYARTTIQVTDEEQSLWVQMWFDEHRATFSWIRRLMLLSPGARTGRNGMMDGVGFSMVTGSRSSRRQAEEAEREDDGDRFAPPKLEFQASHGVSTWTWHGWWPISLVNNLDPRLAGIPGGERGLTLTVWLAPSGTQVTRDILLKGRQLWLAKRSKKTEVWVQDITGRRGGGFNVVTRPSRPLSSVIIDGNIKESLRHDAIRFLSSEKWYVGKGIPYRRGYLLHGPPGCGKTSLVTALAGELRLPIVVVSLNSKYLDDEGLMHAMAETPKDSLILMEDIDCALPRGEDEQAMSMRTMRTGRLPITFSGLLNALDGVGAQEGRLVFMTTNHLDRLDEALIRPGRVDAKFYLGKASISAAGDLFDQFFATTDDKEFNPTVLATARTEFLAHIKDFAYSFAALQGVLTTTRDDPSLVGEAMQTMIDFVEAATVVKPQTNRDILVSMKNHSRSVLEEEKKDEEAQRLAGSVVVKRLMGDPTSCKHDIDKRRIKTSSFTTYGVSEKHATSGVVYYEIQIIQGHDGNLQFGFALKEGVTPCDKGTTAGVGDSDKSWAVDGVRQCKWHDGKWAQWGSKWRDGCVIGLAANVDAGKIAVSVDGTWEKSNGEANVLGVVFEDESIKAGVFPCFSASCHAVKYDVESKHWKYGPPPESVWESTEPKQAT